MGSPDHTPNISGSQSKDVGTPQKFLPTPVSTTKLTLSPSEHSHVEKQSPGTTKSLSKERLLKPAVVVPPVAQPSDYESLNDHWSTKRRKLNSDGENNLAMLRLKDQKEDADAALLRLQDLLHEIFEAEDQLEPDTSSLNATKGLSAIFRVTNALEVTGAILSSETHSRLQKAIQKVLSFGRLQDIPSEYFARIQKLCEGSILSAQAPDLKLDDPSNESECRDWLGKVEDVHNALLAIGTLLQTMSDRQSERDLCPEDLIQAIPNALNQVFDHSVIPAVQSRTNDKDPRFFEFFSREKKVVGNLTHQAKKILTLLANFLSRIDVSEGVVNATEYLATKLIFVENAHSDKESAIGYQKYEAVRRAAMDVLAKIFSRYPLQRPYILDEILISLEKLPSSRQNARQFKLTDGKNIQLLTALVMQLVQTTALDAPHSHSKKKRRLPVPIEDDDELVADDKDQDSYHSDEDKAESPVSLEHLATRVDTLYDNAVRSAQYIVKFIVQRAMTSTKTGDQPYRNILDLFTEDLISVLGSTDWPAAELLLRILASHMVGIAELDKSTAIAKSMALELLGWMGSAISDLATTAQHLIPAMDEAGGDLTEYLRQIFDDFLRHALHPHDLIVANGPYRITLEYLHDRDLDSWQLSSARGYYLVQWAKTVCSAFYDSNGKDEVALDEATDKLLTILSKMLADSRWLETHTYVSCPTLFMDLLILLVFSMMFQPPMVNSPTS